MTRPSTPLLVVLALVLVFFGVWTVALHPSSAAESAAASSAPPPPRTAPQLPGVAGLTRAIAKAHGAVATSDAQSSAAAAASASAPSSGATAASTSAPSASARTAPHSATPELAAAPRRATPHRIATHRSAAPPVSTARASTVLRALGAHQPLVALFYNQAGGEDQALRAELAAAKTPAGVRRYVLSADQLTALTAFASVVQIQTLPTIVIVDRRGRASTLAGFTDRVAISQRIAAALSAR